MDSIENIENEYRMNNVNKIYETISENSNLDKKDKKDIENKPKHLEKIIFEKSNGNYDVYNNILYEIIYKINNINKIIEINEIEQELINGNFLLNEKNFENYKKLQKEKDDFLDKPIDVDESIMDCPKCKSKKTYSYSKQVRSSDEGFTTFSFCFNCQNKWRIN